MTKPIRIVVTRRWPAAVETRLRSLGAVLPHDDAPLSDEELASAFRENDVVCTTITDRITPAMIQAPERRARLICNYGAGVDHVPLSACQIAGVSVTNTPDVLSDATAELALTLMLMLARRTGEGERELRSNAWGGWRPTHMIGRQIAGKTLGLVGFGRIAQATARLAQNLGMAISAYRRGRPDCVDENGVTFTADLRNLLVRSDFVSLHVPGGPETDGLISAAELDLIGPEGFLINTARGSVVDEGALIQALQSGRIAGAGLDVYRGEPDINPALLAAPNVVLLPHLGSATRETRDAMGFCALANLEAWLEGRPLPNSVVSVG